MAQLVGGLLEPVCSIVSLVKKSSAVPIHGQGQIVARGGKGIAFLFIDERLDVGEIFIQKLIAQLLKTGNSVRMDILKIMVVIEVPILLILPMGVDHSKATKKDWRNSFWVRESTLLTNASVRWMDEPILPYYWALNQEPNLSCIFVHSGIKIDCLFQHELHLLLASRLVSRTLESMLPR